MSQDWRVKLVRKLRNWASTRFPVPFPIRVYLRQREQMDDHLGYFLYCDDKERGVICLCDTADREILIDTFLEEWAHARTSHLIDTEDHSDDPWHHPGFWSEYGRLQCAAREVAW
jgi:hypothetical protein